MSIQLMYFLSQFSIKIPKVVHLKLVCACFAYHQDVDPAKFFKYILNTSPGIKNGTQIAKYVVYFVSISHL